MNLTKRIKKLEQKQLPDKELIIVRYPNDVTKLTYRGQDFERLENETENEFINRVVAIVEAIEDRPNVSYLVGNF